MRRILFLIVLIGVFTLNASCGNVLGQLTNLGNLNPSADVLTIDQVSESDGPGQFLLSGKANLPEQTQLTVSAIRNLTLPPDQDTTDQDLRYGILDRRTAMVEDGRWQAKISLWNVSPQGYYRESWQLNDISASDLIQPSPMVDFLLTVEPQEFARVKAKLPLQEYDSQASGLLHVTAAGEPYLGTNKTMAIGLPQKVKASTLEAAQKSPETWQGRTTLDKTRSSIESPAEIPFIGEDNLLISPQNMMR